MRRCICFLLCLCLLCGIGSAFALDLPDFESSDQFSQRVLELWDDLELKDKLDEIDDLELEGLGEELKALAQEAENLSDEELAARIRTLAETHGVSLDDDQIQKIVKLLRSYEKGAELKEKAEDVKEKTSGFMQSLRNFAHKAAAFFQKLSNLLQKV